MSKLWFLPMLLGFHFLFYEHKHFLWFRKLMHKTKVTSFLASCVFCRFTWTGAAIAVVFYSTYNPLKLLGIGVSSGIIGLIFYVAFCPCLRVYERNH